MNERPQKTKYRYVKRRWKVLFSIFDRLVASLPSRLRAGPVHRFGTWPPEKVLLIQLDHIGDAVLSTGIPAAIRRQYPGCRVDVLCSRWTAELFAALPDVHRCIVSHRNWHGRRRGEFATWSELRRLVRLVRQEGYDAAVDIRGDFPTIMLMWLAGIPWRLGWDCAGGAGLLTVAAGWQPGRHELQSRRILLEHLGVRDPLLPQLRPSEAHQRKIDRLLRVVHALPPLVVVHVGAGTPAKRWPTPYYHELVHELHERLAATCILVGGEEDAPIGWRLDSLGTPACNWIGRLSLLELAALCKRVNAFVGPDSGPAHIAAAVGTPTVVLFSGTNLPAQWAPVGPHVVPLKYPTSCSPCCLKVCNRPTHPCMAGVTPDTVARIVERILRRQRLTEPEPESAPAAQPRAA